MPLIVGQVGQNIIMLADTIMVGSLGAVALGAAAFASSLFNVFLVFGIGLLAPMAAQFARIHGQSNESLGGHFLRHSLLITIAASLILTAGLAALLPFMHWFGQTPEVLQQGAGFLKILIASLLPSMLFQNYKQFTDGTGRPKISMYVMTGGVLLNIFGNYFLIHGYKSFPGYGLNGSAYATLISRWLMALILIAVAHLGPHFRHFLQERWTWKFDWELVQDQLRLGMPNALTFLFEVGAFASASLMMGWFGDDPLAAHQITLSLASTTFLIAVGVGIASSIRVGFEMGRGDPRAARFAAYTSSIMGAVFMILCGLGFYFLRRWLPTFYVKDLDVIEWAAKFFMVVALFQLFDGLQAVTVGSLRGLSDTQWPSFMAFVSYWIIGLPLGYFLAFYGGVGPVGIWLGLLAGLVTSSILLNIRFYILSRRYIKSSHGLVVTP